jgi:hypothetical protein
VSPDSIAAQLEEIGVRVTECSVVQPSLEDVFLDVAERSVA